MSSEKLNTLAGIRIQPSTQIKKRNKGIMIGNTCYVSKQCYKRMKKPGCLEGICKRMKVIRMPDMSMDLKWPKPELPKLDSFDYTVRFYGGFTPTRF